MIAVKHTTGKLNLSLCDPNQSIKFVPSSTSSKEVI